MKINFLSTGEFANLCKVNKQTILYYEKIGLLSPDHVNEKGYRYYSFRQVELFSMIDLLKDLGMSLEKIKEYINHKSPDAFLDLMHDQKKVIEEQKQQLRIKESIVNERIKLIEHAQLTDFSEIVVVDIPEKVMYMSRNIKDVSDEEYVEVLSDFINDLDLSRLDNGRQVGGLTKRKELLNEEFTNYTYFYMEQDHEPKSNVMRTQPGKHVIGYHVGLEDYIDETYHRIFQEIERQNLTLGDYSLEEYIYDLVVKDHERQYVTKIIVHAV